MIACKKRDVSCERMPGNYARLFDVNFRPTHMSVSELESGFRDLVEKLYSAEVTKRAQGKDIGDGGAVRADSCNNDY